MKNRFLVTFIILFISFLLYISPAAASEGVVELNNINPSKSRCYAMSTSTNRSNDFNIMIQCQDLIYPIEKKGVYYILWTDPLDAERKKERLGDIEYGKKTFTAREEFSALFITQELTSYPQTPSTNKIMEGFVDPVPFFGTELSPTPKPSPTSKPTPIKNVTPTPQKQGGGGISITILTITIVIIIVIIFSITIFVINRMRNS